MRKDFLHFFYPIQVKVQRFKIVDSLIHFVSQAVRPEFPSHSVEDLAASYRNDINAAMFKFAEFNSEGFPVDISDSDNAVILVDLFKASKKRLQISQLSEISFQDEKLTKYFIQQLGCIECDFESSPPTVLGAYERAKLNYAKIETALVAMNVIRYMVQLRDKSPKSEIAIGDELYAKRRSFMLHILLFGNLLGGDFGKEATKIIANEMLFNPETGVDFSIIQYLQNGAIHPGRYPSKEDEDFRNDIKKCYERITKHQN